MLLLLSKIDKLQLYQENNVFIPQWSYHSHIHSKREVTLWKFQCLASISMSTPYKIYKKKIPYLELKRIYFFYYEYGGSLLKTPLTN